MVEYKKIKIHEHVVTIRDTDFRTVGELLEIITRHDAQFTDFAEIDGDSEDGRYLAVWRYRDETDEEFVRRVQSFERWRIQQEPVEKEARRKEYLKLKEEFERNVE